VNITWKVVKNEKGRDNQSYGNNPTAKQGRNQ
jgi:hypothetical protein